MLTELNPGNVFNLTSVGSTLFFTANDGTHGDELWATNGTAAGTAMVLDIDPGAASSFPARLTNVNGLLFFIANDGIHGNELWESNGTALGTSMVADIKPDAVGIWLANVSGTLFFDANDGVHGDELWRTQGTAISTQMVADINPAPRFVSHEPGQREQNVVLPGQ